MPIVLGRLEGSLPERQVQAMTAPTLLAQPEHHGLVDGMPMDEYLAVQALSAGSARKLLPPSTPASFREDQKHGRTSDGMDFGKVAHSVVLEGVDLTDLANADGLVVVDAADWRTNAAKDAKATARAEGKPALLAKQLPQVRAMAEQILANDMAAALFDPETGKAEQSMFWAHKRTGHPRKGRLDKLPARRPSGRLIIPDYKTTDASADAAEFGRTVVNLGYAQQLAGYEEGVLALELDDDPLFLFVVQETRPPYLVNVLEVPDDGLRIARELNLWACSVYAECVERDTWPGYPAEVQTIQLPSWWLRKYEEFAK